MKRSCIHAVSARVLFHLAVACGVTAIAAAGTGEFELRRGSMSGSGGQSSGGAFTARTTTSQPDAGQPSGGDYLVSGGIAQGDPSKCTALVGASGLLASESFCAAVRLAWFDNSNSESGYRIRRDMLQLADIGPDVMIYDDSTAVPGVIYSYTVMPFNACGEAYPSNTAAGHRPQHPVSPDSIRLAIAALLPESLTVNLRWRDNAADEVSQIVYRVDTTLMAVRTLPPNVEATSVTIPNRGATPVCFAVAAANCGLEAVSETTCVAPVVGIGDGAQTPSLPTAFALGPFMPNPSHLQVIIAFDVPRPAPLAIKVYDVGGRRIRTLREGAIDPGRYRVEWDGRDERRNSTPSGVYFVEMRAPGFRKIARLTRLR